MPLDTAAVPSLDQLLQSIADNRGFDVAVENHEGSITYSRFQDKLSALTKLVAEEVCVGSALAIVSDGNPLAVALVVAALFCRRPFVLLDNSLPTERRRRILELSKPSRVFEIKGDTAQWQIEQPLLRRLSRSIPRIDCWHQMRVGVPQDAAAVYPEETAYVFFTSGSTGDPKGVLGCREGLADFILWQRETFRVDRGDRVAQLTPLSFDVVLRDLLLPLTSGASIVIPPPENRRSLTKTAAWIAEQNITITHLVPTVASTIASCWPVRGKSSLRCVFFAGEPLSVGLVNRWRAIVGSTTQLVNLYGPTETSLAKFFYDIPADFGGSILPVGKALRQTTVQIVDDQGREVPSGCSGEIEICTSFRPLRYLNSPEGDLRFHSPAAQRHTYRTGDLGYINKSGDLVLQGRADDDVKISGVRVSPAEVGALIERLPFVARCVAFTQFSERDSGHTLFAVWTPLASVPTPEDHEAQIRGFLLARLPAASIPSKLTLSNSLPLLTNGKIDRSRLPEFSSGASSSRISMEGEDDPRRACLAVAWAHILGSNASAIDNFFEAGGDSLLALELQEHLRQNSSWRLDFELLYRFPNRSQLFEHLTSSVESRQEAGPSPIYPLMRAQYGFYRFHVQGHEGRAWNNVVGETSAHAACSIEQIICALEKIVARHAALRTTLTRDAIPLQKIHSTPLVQIREIDTTTPTDAELVYRELQSKPFDLHDGPLLICAAVRNPGSTTLLLAAHHLIVDGYSMRLLENEMRQLLTDTSAAREKPPLLDYRDAIVWDGHVRGSAQYAADLEYAVALFEGYEPPELYPAGASKYAEATKHRFGLTESSRQAIENRARENGSSVFLYLYGTFVEALHFSLKCDELITGFLFDGREAGSSADLIANLASVRHIRTRLTSHDASTPLVKQLQVGYADAIGHRSYEFVEVLDKLGVDTQTPNIPGCSILINFTQAPKPSLSEWPMAPEIKHDMMLYVSWDSQRPEIELEYRTVIHQSIIESILTSFAGVLEAAEREVAAC